MKKAAILLALLSGTVSAETAGELEVECKAVDGQGGEQDVFNGAFCMGYLSGVIDGARSSLALVKQTDRLLCLPAKGISNDQVRRIFLKHIGEFPERMHMRAELVVIGSVALAFPCEKQLP